MSGLSMIPVMAMLLQADSDPAAALAGAGFGLGFCLFELVVLAFAVLVVWKLFVKMGRQGWEGIIPFYNNWVVVQLMGRPVWVFILWIIPCTAIVGHIMISLDMARKFGKSQAFAIGLILLAPIFYAILAFDDSRFQG